jgi:catechol 2,3-dioxygenase-like lactoylglutathione lyase family enzyme
MRILHTMIRVGNGALHRLLYKAPGDCCAGTVIAFVEDPDGYKIEFVQRKRL